MKIRNLLPKRPKNANKGTFGTVLNISGSEMYFGAAILSSVSALRVGTGKVILCSVQNVLSSACAFAPEIIPIKQENINIENVNAIILGCGLSTDKDAVNIFEKTISSAKNIPIIIDADGLNILSKKDYELPKNTILTPHPKEMSRLMNVDLEEVLNNPKNILKKCVQKYGATVVLKLHSTLVMSTQTDEIYINKTGNTALSKAGSGDILAGIIGGFLAQGMTCFDAARLGVYLHGLAGELAAKDSSEYSVLASDLLEYIGKAIKKIS